MIWLLTAVHIVFCVVMMIVILLQAGKGAEMGAVFGGSSQTIFGSRGAATFLSKVTTVCAIGFMITSLSLVYLGSKESTQSILDKQTSQPAPAPTSDNAAAPAVTVTPEATSTPTTTATAVATPAAVKKAAPKAQK